MTMVVEETSLSQLGAQTRCKEECDDSFKLQWRQLCVSYTESNFFSTKKQRSQVFCQPCNGEAESGCITAILGPSGSGKSTLIKCLTGRVTQGDFSGECFIDAPRHLETNLRKSRIAYVPQTDDFLMLFSVRETLLFASRMNNVTWSRQDHMESIRQLLTTLDMSDKIDWPLIKLSGGQMKRIAIATEVITRPTVLLLDEPTSGLDADNAERLIHHLKSIANGQHSGMQTAVLVTIHSPSTEVFALFDQVYILSTGGYNIYTGPPDFAFEYFRSYGFDRLRGNPAEACIEIASGKYGSDKFALMSSRNVPTVQSNEFARCKIAASSINTPNAPLYLQIFLLMIRFFIYYSVKLPQIVMRIFIHIMNLTAGFMVQLGPMGQNPQCWHAQSTFDRSSFDDTSLATMKIKMDFLDRFKEMNTIISFGMIFMTKIVYIATLTSVLLVRHHKAIYCREMRNTWYTKNCFFFSKFLVDALVRLMCIVPCGFVISFFSYSSMEIWRIVIISCSIYILSSIWEHIASIIAIYCGPKMAIIEVVGYIFFLVILDVLMIDFMSFHSNVTNTTLFIRSITPMNTCLGTVIISFFGFGRCRPAVTSMTSLLITGNEEPNVLISRVWNSLNMTRTKVVNQLDILDVDEEYASDLYDLVSPKVGTERYIGEAQSSFILSFFGYEDWHIVRQFCILMAWAVITFLILWISIKKKFN